MSFPEERTMDAAGCCQATIICINLVMIARLSLGHLPADALPSTQLLLARVLVDVFVLVVRKVAERIQGRKCPSLAMRLHAFRVLLPTVGLVMMITDTMDKCDIKKLSRLLVESERTYLLAPGSVLTGILNALQPASTWTQLMCVAYTACNFLVMLLVGEPKATGCLTGPPLDLRMRLSQLPNLVAGYIVAYVCSTCYEQMRTQLQRTEDAKQRLMHELRMREHPEEAMRYAEAVMRYAEAAVAPNAMPGILPFITGGSLWWVREDIARADATIRGMVYAMAQRVPAYVPFYENTVPHAVGLRVEVPVGTAVPPPTLEMHAPSAPSSPNSNVPVPLAVEPPAAAPSAQEQARSRASPPRSLRQRRSNRVG